jgi:hypothetical protein
VTAFDRRKKSASPFASTRVVEPALTVAEKPRTSKRAEHVFMVRIWSEDADRASWRGSIVHVGSGRRFFFSNIAEVVEFVRASCSQGPMP